MVEVKVREDEYGRIATTIPISDKLFDLGLELMDDYLSPCIYHRKLKELRKLISEETGIEVPEFDSWSLGGDEDASGCIIFYKDKTPLPPDKLKTGHIYFNNYMEGLEGADDCGTCNGARCETCREVYRDREGLLHNWPPKEKDH